MEILELQIFQNKQWLIGFIIISIVGSISRIIYNWKHTPKEVTYQNAGFYVFFGLVVCFFGEIFLTIGNTLKRNISELSTHFMTYF